MTHRSAEYHKNKRKEDPEKYLKRDKDKYAKRQEVIKAQQKQKRREYPKPYMITQVKARAKRLGIDFNLCEDDFEIPKVCPILGIPLFIGEGKICSNSPSLDRVDNSLGYVKGNVRVISFKANRYKSDLTLIQVEQLLIYMKG